MQISYLPYLSITALMHPIKDELEEKGIFFDVLKEEVGKDFDPLELICHVAYEARPLTRKERAENVKKRNYFAKYSEKAQLVIQALLDKDTNDGMITKEDTEVLRMDQFIKLGTSMELIKAFGSRQKHLEALKEMEQALYKIGA